MTRLTLRTKAEGPSVAKDFYGLFFEDINRAADSGLYPEMLRNRSFEDSLLPAETEAIDGGDFFRTKMGFREQFFRGEGTRSWAEKVAPTDVPAWYADNASIELLKDGTLNAKRLAALKADFEKDGVLYNVGYVGVPALKGKTCRFYAFLRSDADLPLQVRIAGADGTVYAQADIIVKAGDYARYDAELTPDADDTSARFEFKALEKGTLILGFTSLMPADTYMGHGLRKDLMELLKLTNSHFMRFPGGCIVEGLNKDTAMRFTDTVGPVWERPSKWNLWHYRSTNGLGFHEYLQLCEDLGMEALYVVNCGMTCQGRGPEFFLGEELDSFVDETFMALEYAMGGTDTRWGALRAEMGHPEPFRIKYIEIGNENDGPEYDKRYPVFYQALQEKYPDIILISNAHTERRGLPTQIVDEHYYNDWQFFFQSGHLYDRYDKKGPQVFLGEYAVTRGEDVGTLRSALSESAFLMGAEHNPEVVTLTAYAPLFENIHYASWNPNLIRFDNARSCGIPFAHALSILGADRGETLIREELETEKMQPVKYGFPGFIAYTNGVRVASFEVDGKPAEVSKTLTGRWLPTEDGFVVSNDEGNEKFGNVTRYPVTLHMTHSVLGLEQNMKIRYRAKVYVDESTPKFALTVWTHNTTEPGFRGLSERRWNLAETEQYSWTVENGKGRAYYLYRYQEQPLGESFDMPIRYGEVNEFEIVTDETGYDCYLNGEHVQRVQDRTYGKVTVLAQQDDGHVYVKLLNGSDTPETVKIDVDIPMETGFVTRTIQGSPSDTNTPDSPETIRVEEGEGTLDGSGAIVLPAWSLTGIRWKKK